MKPRIKRSSIREMMLEAYALGWRDQACAVFYVRARLHVDKVSNRRLHAAWADILAEKKGP